MSISQSSLEEIKARIEIEEVVSDFLSLKRKGQNLWACCPFHDEKTPSFSVSPSKGIFKCFGCGKAGDAIEFVKEIEGLDYLEAMKFLGKKYGIELEEAPPTPEDIARQSHRDSLFIVLNFAKEYYQKTLWENEKGRSIGLSYFKERGYPEKVIRNFELGYSLQDWDGLRKQALSQGYQEQMLIEAGLVVEKEDKVYDRFRGRVIFPIHNITGKVIAFGARTLTQKGPKYLNSPETDVYQKSKVLYGLHQARTAIRQEDNCYLVEGYTDVISLHLSGIPNVVASSGTSLTEDQIKLIKRYTNNITVLFDGDAAGIKAALRGIDMILSSGANVRVVEFPPGEDPDSYASKLGSSEFQKFLQQRVTDFITYKTQLFLQEAQDDPIKRVQTIKEVVQSISKIPDALQRAIYLKKCSGLLEIDESLLIGELNKLQLKTSRYSGQEPPPLNPQDIEVVTTERLSRNPSDAITHQERESIRLLLNYGNSMLDEEQALHQYFFQELADLEFKTPSYQTIMDLLKSCIESQGRVDAQTLLENARGPIKLEIINLLSEKYEISSYWMDKFQIYVPQEQEILSDVAYSNLLRLKYRVIKKLIDENREELKQVKALDQEQKLLQVDLELKKSRNELAKLLGIVVSD